MNILVPAFLTVVIGGVGTIAGAVVGGLIIGLVQATLIGLPSVTIASFTLNFSPWSQVGLYAIAAVILLVRPQGILGDEEVAP
jgi:branched-chain amino acid transport system permease protein